MCSTCNCKRWTTNFTVACFFLAGGVEYSVILPTMFDYLTKHFDGKEWLYGLCLSAFSISNLFMGPLFGFVFDWTHRTKLIVLFANLFEIGGIRTPVSSMHSVEGLSRRPVVLHSVEQHGVL